MGVELVRDGGVAQIRLNRPPANSYNHDFYKEFEQAIDTVRWTKEIVVAVIISETAKFFSAGADIGYLLSTEPVLQTQFCLYCNETLDKMARSPQIFIACLEGHTVGGGLELALAADMRFAADDERIKIGLPEVTLGVLPATGGTQRLARLIGVDKALDLCVTGRLLNPRAALELGLVTKVLPPEEMRARTMEYAHKLAGGATRAVRNIKLAIINGIEMPLNAALRYEGELQNLLLGSEDAKEGLSAFVERRKPQWRGR